ncbi:Uncharacterised protein [Bordetella pertussis]|nr:Uncharacterised protein [Bordetella pertussis]CFW89148.1 Uncharacterised protein [Bordetella pertussis]CPI91480.1 Uncharacterised protein [Bordetella pertussis]
MRSGMRAPVDSPRKISGRPFLVATSRIWRIFLPLTTELDAPITVKSLATTATLRAWTLP